jgi:hypothetical protein
MSGVEIEARIARVDGNVLHVKVKATPIKAAPRRRTRTAYECRTRSAGLTRLTGRQTALSRTQIRTTHCPRAPRDLQPCPTDVAHSLTALIDKHCFGLVIGH